ncbi:MAG: hypothetical protein ACLSXF_05830 [Clostridium sp.]
MYGKNTKNIIKELLYMKKYNIAGITFEIDFNFKLKKEEEAFLEFKSKGDMNEKEVFKLTPQKLEKTKGLSKVQETPILSVYKNNEGYIREFTSIYTNKKYAWLDEDKNIVYYDNVQQKKVLTHMFCIMELIGIEHTLCKHKTFMLHSSYINYNGGAILFSGPSGIGKSTQADLWQEFQGAEIINGDRTAISKNLGSWHAYGLPFAGSSKIYKNKTLPIKAVVILKQGKENCIRKVKPMEAFKALYSEITVNSWNKNDVETIIKLVETFIKEVPIYVLSCLPNKEAVYLLKKEIERGE